MTQSLTKNNDYYTEDLASVGEYDGDPLRNGAAMKFSNRRSDVTYSYSATDAGNDPVFEQIYLTKGSGQMSQFKTGAAALGALQSGGNDGGPKAEISKFSSGTTYKVRVKGTEDLLQYFNYGIFKKVHSFVPKNPAERNERGFITANPTPWDKAAQYYYDKANAESDAIKKDELQKEGYKYRGKEKFLLGFNNLETGEDFVVDLTKQQALDVYAVITKYEKRLGKIAFELSKTGSSTATKVSLSPIIDMEEDLTDVERANFEKADQPFNVGLFDGVLFEADEKTQIENLVAAGFDISLIGLSIGRNGGQDDEATPIDGAMGEITDDDLPF